MRKFGSITIILLGILGFVLLGISLLNPEEDNLYGWPISQTSCPTPACDEQ